jgi:hypothetical protein
MESITHLYDCTLGCNGEYRSSYDCTLDCNGEYCSPFSLYLRLQWRVSLTFMNNLMYSHKDDAQSPLKSNVQS